jgi:hypothetical protein
MYFLLGECIFDLEKVMKKTLVVSLFLALVLILSSCASTKTQPTNSTVEIPPAPVVQVQPQPSSTPDTILPKDSREAAILLLTNSEKSGKVPLEFLSVVKLENYEVISQENGISSVLFSSNPDKKGGYKLYFFKQGKSVGSIGIYLSKMQGATLPVNVWSKSLPNGKLTLVLKKGGNTIGQQSIDLQDLFTQKQVVFQDLKSLDGANYPLRANIIFE